MGAPVSHREEKSFRVKPGSGGHDSEASDLVRSGSKGHERLAQQSLGLQKVRDTRKGAKRIERGLGCRGGGRGDVVARRHDVANRDALMCHLAAVGGAIFAAERDRRRDTTFFSFKSLSNHHGNAAGERRSITHTP